MAFNGITVACLCHEISDKVTGGRIYKIAQPENDEIILTIKPEMSRGGGQVRLLLSADASLPLCYFTENSKASPAQAPTFCMLLRKYITNGKISSVTQPGLERILRFEIEHLNEMGDVCHHTLVLELMGKYSNLIFIDENEQIVDSIKHISGMVSSVREVLPGRPYFIPETQNKRDPLSETEPSFYSALNNDIDPSSLLVKTYTGFSNITGNELCSRADIKNDMSSASLDRGEKDRLWNEFHMLVSGILSGNFRPTVYGIGDKNTSLVSNSASHDSHENGLESGSTRFIPKEYSAFELKSFSDMQSRTFAGMSALLEFYYAEKNKITRIHQRSSDLRRIVQTLLERDLHKYDLQCKQLKDTEKKDKYRVYGELLNVYGYEIPEGSKSAILDNYYTNEKTTVPLDPMLSPAANAKKNFERYNKLKRTAEALTELTAETKAEIDQLESIKVSLEVSADDADLAEIKQEMIQSGLIHHRGSLDQRVGGKGGKSGKSSKQRITKSKPLHYVSSDGYDIYVGKNNLQNDELTFKFANGGDLWFHANDIPGSHVVLKTNGDKMDAIPDRTFVEAASLAAYYSSGREQSKVEIDYLLRKDVKKPAGSRPGFVVYYTNYSMNAVPEICKSIQQRV